MAVERVADSTGLELGLSYLDRVIASGGDSVPMPRGAAEELSAAVDAWRPGGLPRSLVARPCPMSAARWHLEHLAAARGPESAVRRAQRIYHARMLGFLLAPERPQFRPLVTVLIPVYNRARQIADAVECCLAQDWRPIEVLVVDDGSTDDLAAALRPFGEQVRVLRKSNGGVASARNAGIAAARGDFIHYLDSDDLLLPGTIARKVEAFVAIADAELCYNLSDDRGEAERRAQVPPPTGTRHCPTCDLMRIVAIRFPFIISTLMLTRWTALDTAPFEEDLRRSSDARYNVGLGLRGTKVIGFADHLTIRNFSPDGLTGTARFDSVRSSLIRLRNLRDVLAMPSGWQYAARYLARLVQQRGLDEACRSGDPRIERALEEVVAAVQLLAADGARDGLSTLPLMASLRHECRQLQAEGRWRLAAGNPLAQLPELFATALAGAAPIGAADLAFWSDGPGRRAERPAINVCLGMLARRYRGDAALLDAASWLLRRSRTIPDRRSVKVLVFLRRWLRSSALARTAALLAVTPGPARGA